MAGIQDSVATGLLLYEGPFSYLLGDNGYKCGVSGYGVFKREMSTVPLVSSRWNPTPEQLQALEEMYRRGTRTPSADQIQQIAAKLRKFGKIEGKNVFYWFQNHKARERQKKRRQQELLVARKMRQVETPVTVTQSGLSSKYSELEHPKKLPTPSSCSSSTVLQNCVEECKKDGWTVLLDEKDDKLQTKTAKKRRTETCSPLDLSSCMPLKQQITAQKLTLGQENENPFVPLKLSNVFNSDDLRSDVEIISGIKENQTLQLFPVRSNDNINVGAAEEEIGTDDDLSSVGVTKLVPSQFFEFLPTKN